MAGRPTTSETARLRARRLGRQLAGLRQQARLTQEAVAHEAGIAVSTLRKIESGATAEPTFFRVADLCQVLGVDLSQLAAIAAEPPTQDI